MAGRVDPAQGFDAHLGVDRGRFEAGVAEELLDVADVGPAFEEVLCDEGAEGVGVEALAVASEEERSDDARDLQPGPLPGQ